MSENLSTVALEESWSVPGQRLRATRTYIDNRSVFWTKCHYRQAEVRFRESLLTDAPRADRRRSNVHLRPRYKLSQYHPHLVVFRTKRNRSQESCRPICYRRK